MADISGGTGVVEDRMAAALFGGFTGLGTTLLNRPKGDIILLGVVCGEPLFVLLPMMASLLKS